MIPERLKRISELFKRQIGYIIQNELTDPRIGFTTVTGIDVAKDLRSAVVFVSVMGDEEKKRMTVEVLNHAHHYIQDLLGKRVYLRYLPSLRFEIDNTLDYTERIDSIIQRLRKEEGRIEEGDVT